MLLGPKNCIFLMILLAGGKNHSFSAVTPLFLKNDHNEKNLLLNLHDFQQLSFSKFCSLVKFFFRPYLISFEP